MNNKKTPTVTLGMPVYNGENYLENTLDSILAQTYTDFELIITDNASTDRTQEICEAYAARDSRIRYIRNAENLGAAPNYNLSFQLAAGKYFKWVAHDDPNAPTCIELCVQMLESHPDAILSYARTILIDEDDQVIEYHQDRYDLQSRHPHERLYKYFHETSAWCHPVFGLIHTDVLAKTGLIGSYASSDKTLLAEMAVLGKCYEVPAHLAYRRLHPKNSTEANKTDEAMASWFDPRIKRAFLTPRWRRFLEHLKSVQRANIPLIDKIRCYGVIFAFYLSPGRVAGVTKDMGQLGKALRRLF